MTVDVSVLMPAKNAGATVDAAVRSVLKTADVDLELVVVDHASDDDTRRRAQAFAARDRRVRVVDAAPALGLGDVLNAGRAHCRAPFIARMDADDVMHPQRLAHDVEALRADRALGAVASRVRLFPSRAVGVGMHTYMGWQNQALGHDVIANEIWVEQPLCHPATTFRASALDAVGGYRHGPFPEDYDVFLRLLLAGWRFHKHDRVFHFWREHDDKSTHRDPRYSRDAFFALKAAALMVRFGLKERPVFIAGAGKEGGRIGRMLKRLDVGLTAYFDIADKRVGRVRHGVPCVHADALEAWRRRYPGAFLIGAVGTSGGRGVVRERVLRAGFIEGNDAVMVA